MTYPVKWSEILIQEIFQMRMIEKKENVDDSFHENLLKRFGKIKKKWKLWKKKIVKSL